MIVPTCFEDLDWSENAKPTSSHFLALIMALRERIAFAEPSSLPSLDGLGFINSNYEYNALSLDEIKDWFDEINGMLYALRVYSNQALAMGDYELTESIAEIETPIVWMPTDTELPVENELSQKLYGYSDWLLPQEKIVATSIDDALMVHRYKEIDFKAVMKILNQYKNAIGGLTEAYAHLDTLAVYRPQYYIDWTRESAEEARPSFTAIQERKDYADMSTIEADWAQNISDPPQYGDFEWLEFLCNDCDIPYIFKLPAVVSVHCWESTDSDEDEPTEWYYDFGTGLNKGWNNLGTHNLGERIPLLPKQGWGDARATAVPPKRNAVGWYTCTWGIDFIKFDFRNSLKFKVLPADA